MSAHKKLHHHLALCEAENTFSGVVRITRGGTELFARAYGPASRSWSIANTLDTRFDTASITKLFTSVATLQMIDQGKLSLDTKIVEFLELTNTSISPEATVFHLLTHSSGIGDDCEEEDGERYEDLWLAKPNYAVTETADFLPQFAQKPANFKPGERCRYCNCSWVLLGLAIEKLTGRTFREVVQEQIFTPAGMSDSGFFRMDEAHPRIAEGADPIEAEDGSIIGWRKNIYSYPPIGSPDSGALVTAADLDRFFRAILDGELLSPELSEAFFTPQVKDREIDDWTQYYSFGLWFMVDGDGRVICCEKEGVNAGVSAEIRRFPDRDLHVVVLSNMEAGSWSVMRFIHGLVIEGAFDAPPD